MRAHLLSLDHIGGFAGGLRPAKVPPAEQCAAASSAPEDAAPARESAHSLGLLDRIDAWFWRMQQREIEAYLARSSDICDLEARIRALGRPSPNPYY